MLHVPPGKEITIPELGVNAFCIAVDSGRVRETIPGTEWELHYRDGSSLYMPGYEEHKLRSLERRPMLLALIVPPPAKYEVRAP